MKKIYVRSACALIGASLLSTSAAAAVSDLPLTGSSTSVPPNIMFTLDDSGSMNLECMRDAMCGLAGSTVVGVLPFGLTNAISYQAGPNAVLLRSTFNPLYYNPASRYRPWRNSDGTRWPQYPASAVVKDPRIPTGPRFDLTREQSLNMRWCNSGCVQSTESFMPAIYYQLRTAGANADQPENYEKVQIGSTANRFPKGAARDDCAASADHCTLEEELQNFSNWFVYSRSRLFVAIGGTAEAFAQIPPTFRVGFGAINASSTAVDSVSTATVKRGVREFEGQQKKEFYDLLTNAKATGWTPLRRALDDVGKYFTRNDARSPWAASPASGEAAERHLSCRRAFHVLMTDGVWNEDAATTEQARADVDSADGQVITHADGKSTWQYKAASPYAGAGGNTLADVAMYYWNRDLRPDLPNNVQPTNNDPAFWQHMVNYTVAFGLNGALRNPEDLPELTAGTKSWGTPKPDALANIDDLWHAALNSRGMSKSAANNIEYTAALASIIEDIKGRGGKEAGVAVSSTAYSATERKYVPSYKTGEWTGDVEAISIGDGKRVWLASEKLPLPDARNIFTFSGTAGVEFKFASLDTVGLTRELTRNTASAPALVNYLRGNRTGEGTTFRTRAKLIGDIINSSPVFVKDLFDGQYDFLPAGTSGRSTYLAFRQSKSARTPQLFVGANDGMLHAFHDGTSNLKGTESFAFVPKAVLSKVERLADPAYTHAYFVDGALTEFDVYDTPRKQWRNLVAGGSGAGAKNLFAINVPVPALPATGAPVPLTDATSAPSASDILWEIGNASSDFKELGHVLRAPSAGVLKSGSWAVLSGNGYDSASGRARLFIIDALTGALIKDIDTGVGSAASPNGLGGVELLRDDNQRVVAAYAGDLLGNMWKFDLSSDDPANWGVAFSAKPLFKALDSASNAEPITAAPALARHPLGGVMVLAGTGKLFETGDEISKAERSLYGVWDKVPVGSASTDQADAVSNNNALVTQTMSSGGQFYTATQTPVDYGSTASKRGWVLRLTGAAGQRVITDVRYTGSRAIFDAMTPGTSSGGCDSAAARGATFVLDPFVGGPSKERPTFDTNNDGVIDAMDLANAAGISTGDSLGSGGIMTLPGGFGVLPRADANPRVALGLSKNKRQWRQIATPPKY